MDDMLLCRQRHMRARVTRMLLQVQLPRMYPPPRRQCMERYCIFPSISADMYAYMSVHGKVSVLHSSPLPLCLRVCCRIGVWMHAFVGSTCRQVHAQPISVLRVRTSADCGRMDACICRQRMSARIAAAHVRAHCHLHVSGRPANMCERCFCFLHKPFCFFWHNGVDAACGTRATCVRALSVRR